MTEPTCIVSLQDVSKRFVRGSQVIEVFHGLDLTVAAGEFLAVVGPSGAGKSTLLNMIGGIDRPSSGCITVANRRVDLLQGNELADWRARNVGFIFQFYNLLPWMTAYSNVEVPLLLTSIGKVERRARIEFALQLVGLADRRDHRPTELSGGEQQRVAIARAIIADPPLLICDEPTGDLDARNAREICELLKALSQRHGKTCIVVSHDPLVASYASRIMNLDKERSFTEARSKS
jgi:putative ABC transport system ATP-binding protein